MQPRKMTGIALIVLFLSLTLTALPAVAAPEADDTMTMLTKELKLNQDQAKKMGAEIDKFAKTLDQLKADQEKEGADPDALVQGAKQAQEAYLKSVKKILTPEQFQQYNALKEKSIKSMCLDLAEIQLMEVQPKIGISDEQITKLVPTMGDSLYQVVTIAWEHAGERLRPGQKIKIAKQLKQIEKSSRDAASKVLTPQQMEAWDKLKAQQKEQKKGK